MVSFKREGANWGFPVQEWKCNRLSPILLSSLLSFSEELNGLMDYPSPLVRRFMALLEPVDDARLEAMAQESRRLT